MNIRSCLCVAALGVIGCSADQGPQQTVHTMPIRADETWSRSGSPHIVHGQIFISGGATLTIEAGATVLFDTAAELVFGRIGSGTLRALGDIDNPIQFRNIDMTNRPGVWAAIALRSNTASEMHYVDVSGCGASAILFFDSLPSGCLILGNPLLSNESPTLLIDHVSVHDAKGGAVVVSNDAHVAPGSTVLTVVNMRGYIARMRAREAPNFPTGGAFAGNDSNEVRLTMDTIRTNATWPAGVPWTVDTLFVEGSSQPVLTILPGATIKMRGAIMVGSHAPGGLQVGAENAAIVTFSAADTSWGGIDFSLYAITSSITNAVLDNCGHVENARFMYPCVAVIGDYFRVQPDPALLLKHVTIRALETGLSLGLGGRLAQGSTDVTITGSSGPSHLYGFGPPISIGSWSSPSSIPPGNYTGTFRDEIWLTSLEVRHNDTFPNFGMPYIAMFNGIAVGDSTTHPTLTLLPGTTIQFTGGSHLWVGWDAPGVVNAVGTAAQPITLTGQGGSPGAWAGVKIGYLADSSSLFDHVVVDNAGAADPWVAGAFQFYKDIGPVIKNSTIRNSAGCGINIINQPPWSTDFTDPALSNTFTSNAGGAVCGP